MPNDTPDLKGPVLRVFEVRANPGHAEEVLKAFSSTSADVVRGKPGNHGYFFGRLVQGPNEGDGSDPGDGNGLVFVSVWENLDAIKERFGDEWQVSHIPDGYEYLLESYSVRHFDLTDGWHVSGV